MRVTDRWYLFIKRGEPSRLGRKLQVEQRAAVRGDVDRSLVEVC